MALKFADCHNDLLLGVLHQKERGVSDPFGEFWLPQLREGNVVTQVLPVYTEEQFVGEGALRRSLLLFETAWAIAEAHPNDVLLCTTGKDVLEAHASGKIALILAVEGAEPVGHSIDIFESFFRMGVRLLSLTWNRRTMFADGVGERDTGGTLTSLGIEAIKEMERVGIILDVSHISENGFWHLNEVATKPFIASHSSLYSLCDHPRNLKNEQAKRIGEVKGIICLNAFGGFLSADPKPIDLIAHAKLAIELVGEDRVAFGFDFMKDLLTQVDPVLTGVLMDPKDWPFVPGLDQPADLRSFGELLVSELGEQVANKVGWKNLTDTMVNLLP